MKFKGTPEMNELEKQFMPYIMKNGEFAPDTPQSVKDAEKKYVDLVNSEYDRLSQMYRY